MKKILTAVLCLGLVGTLMLGSCGKKEEKKEENLFIPEEIVEEQPEVVVPQEQLDFEFEVNSFNMEAKITGYLGEEKNVVIPQTVIDPEYGDVLTVTKIGTMAFAKNENIEVVILPETVTDIEKGAFQSCPNLRAVSLPYGLETIEEYAFYNSNNIDKLGMVIGNEPSDEEVEVPEATEVAADYEAAQDENLYDTIGNQFPSTVTEIGLMAFSSQLNEIAWYTALEGDEVILGDGILIKYNVKGDYTLSEDVKKVAYYAFSNTAAAVITINNPEIEVDDNALFECDKELKFIIPDGAQDLASSISAAGCKYEFLSPAEQEEAVVEEAVEEVTQETAAE